MGYYDKYLEHHGIKGQKWGVRRFQNADGSLTSEGIKRYGTVGPKEKVSRKDMREFRNQLSYKYTKDDPRTKVMDKLENEAYALLEKHDFDPDDGGGGTTEADRRAGQKYMELFDKYQAIETQRDADIGKKVESELIAKYGEERVKSLKTADTASTTAAVLGAVALTPVILITLPVTIPLAIVGGAIYGSASKKKAEKVEQKKEETSDTKQ